MSTCFVMMPFGGYFDGYYTNVLRAAVSECGLSPVRADEIYGTGAIVDDIYRAIVSAELCIADVTSRNPNVSYELGMAHASHKPVVLITQDLADVPFDYRHLRIIKYDPKTFGWERDFSEALRRTLEEVRRDPRTHAVLKSAPGDPEKTLLHLKAMFYSTGYDLDRTNRLVCDEHGNTVIQTSWRLVAKTPVFHLCHNIVLDKPGRIEVRRVADKMSARDLEWVTADSGPTYLSYFFLFKQFKTPGQHFEATTEVYAENYFDFAAFRKSGETMMSTQAVEGGIRFARRTDLVYLPKTPAFAGVFAEYRSHPDSSLVGTRVAATEEDAHYVLPLVYDIGSPYQQETAAVLKLPFPR